MVDGWAGGWMGGWLENEFLKETPSPKFGLESQLGTSNFGVCQYTFWHIILTDRHDSEGMMMIQKE